MDNWEYIKNLEREWKRTLPQYTALQLAEMFPEAKKIIIENLRNEIEQARADLHEADRLEAEIDNIIYCTARPESADDWKMVCYGLISKPFRGGGRYGVDRNDLIKKNSFMLNVLSGKAKKGELDIPRAKLFPIEQLIKFNPIHKARCIWHTEKTASMHYYKKTNRVKCFGCDAGGDAIDVYMALNKSSFNDAVKALAV